MRRRHTLPAALAALAATSLLLTACGSDDEGGGDDDKVTGADDASSAPPSPKQSEPETDRPEIRLPSYAKVTFEESETGDPVKDAILQDHAQRALAAEEAILTGELTTSTLTSYTSGEALAGTKDFIKSWVDAGDKWAGTIRYYDREVTIKDDRTASVISCADENKSWITKNPESGKKPEEQPPSADNYVMYNSLLEKNDEGIWVTTRMISDRGAERCQP